MIMMMRSAFGVDLVLPQNKPDRMCYLNEILKLPNQNGVDLACYVHIITSDAVVCEVL